MNIFPTSNFGFLITNPTTFTPVIHPRTITLPRSFAETSQSEISEALAILISRSPGLLTSNTERGKPNHDNHQEPQDAMQKANEHMKELLTIIFELRLQKRAQRSLEFRFWQERKQRKNSHDLPPNPIPDRSLPEGISFQMAQVAVSQEDADTAESSTTRILQRILRRLPRPGEIELPHLR